jgi:hypothetical protein
MTVKDCLEPCPFCSTMNKTPDRETGDPILDPPPEIALRFMNAKAFPPGYLELPKKMRTPGLVPVAETLASSIYRLQNLVELPAFLIYISAVMERHCDKARMKVFECLEPSSSTPEQDANFVAKFNELWGEWERSTSREALLRGVQGIGEGRIETMIRGGGAFALSAFEALLIGQIAGAWTAFETAAGDLWEAALNAHPHGLAELKGQAKRIATKAGARENPRMRSQAEAGGQQPGDEKTVPLKAISRITRGKYDLSNRMGTLLRGGFNFTHLQAIRKAYSVAFHEQAEEIDETLANKSLDGLSAVRNLLVHRAGIIDQEYIEKAKGVAGLPSGEQGERLPVTGDLAGSFTYHVMALTMKLVESVDQWIQSHTR